jgi:hypothetical protein
MGASHRIALLVVIDSHPSSASPTDDLIELGRDGSRAIANLKRQTHQMKAHDQKTASLMVTSVMISQAVELLAVDLFARKLKISRIVRRRSRCLQTNAIPTG